MTAMEKTKAIFFHIPKTGGMTFRELLRRIFGPSFHVCKNPAIADVEDKLKQFACLEFHTVPYNGDFMHAHREIVQQARWDLLLDAHLFIMFREPVGHLISQYYDMQRKRDFIAPLYKKYRAFPETLEEFLIIPQNYNTQVAFVLGEYPFAMNRAPDRRDLETAKGLLTTLKMNIGLTERYGESVHIFETVSGRRLPERKIKIHNRNLQRPSLDAIDSEIIRQIRERSMLDSALYDCALELFERQLQACGPSSSLVFEYII
jgi:hypothetical protein